MRLEWSLKKFNELTSLELYQIIGLREKVFVVEQKIIYLDCDGKDPDCLHLFAKPISDVLDSSTESKTIAYTRILPAGLKYNEVSFGRVVVDTQFRQYGIGKLLIQKTMEQIQSVYGNVSVRISAQAYLEKFYTNFGFSTVGSPYIEEDIPHLNMLYRPIL